MSYEDMSVDLTSVPNDSFPEESKKLDALHRNLELAKSKVTMGMPMPTEVKLAELEVKLQRKHLALQFMKSNVIRKHQEIERVKFVNERRKTELKEKITELETKLAEAKAAPVTKQEPYYHPNVKIIEAEAQPPSKRARIDCNGAAKRRIVPWRESFPPIPIYENEPSGIEIVRHQASRIKSLRAEADRIERNSYAESSASNSQAEADAAVDAVMAEMDAGRVEATGKLPPNTVEHLDAAIKQEIAANERDEEWRAEEARKELTGLMCNRLDFQDDETSIPSAQPVHYSWQK